MGTLRFLRLFPFILAVAAIGSLAAVPPAVAQATVTFAVFGDYYANPAGTPRVAALVNSWAPEFIVTTGDNTNQNTTAGLDAQVGVYYGAYIRYPAGSASAYAPGPSVNRFFPSLGNHDWDTSISGWTEYFELPGNERYYDFVRGPVHFFILDAAPQEPDGITATSAQALWLQAGLAASTSPWDVVVIHRPPFSSSSNHGSAPELQWPYADWGAELVLAGHDHCYERLEIDGIAYVTEGTGGQALYGFGTPVAGSIVRYSADHGAMRVVADEDSMVCEHFSVAAGPPGTLVDRFVLRGPGVPSESARETFDAFPVGQAVGTQPGWYAAGDGPLVQTANGVAGSRGLANSSSIFTWSAHPFIWGDPGFQRIAFEMDFQTSGGGSAVLLDDDRIGWMTTVADVNSDYFFGVQMDPVTDPSTGLQLEGYWRNEAGDRIAVPLADLGALSPNTWYRLRLEVAKLGDTAAGLEATVTQLDAAGVPGAVVAAGGVPNTSLISPVSDRPAARYFTTAPAYPSFKNHSNVAGAADNAYYEIGAAAGGPWTLTTNTVGDGAVTRSPDLPLYADGTVVTLTAVPDPGWMLAAWSGDLAGNANPATVTMTRNRSVTATFAVAPVVGPIAHWTFDEGAGTTAADASGRGHTATLVGAGWEPGQFGSALSLPGGTAHATVAPAADLELPTNRMTLAFWVRADQLSEPWVTALQRSNPAGDWFDWQFYARAEDAPTADHPVFRVDWDRDKVIDAGEQVQGDAPLLPGVWYHLAVTYDGAALRLYVDGTLRGSTARAGAALPAGGRAIRMGANDVWGEPLVGSLDDVRIYNRALSGEEIELLLTPGVVRHRVDVSVAGLGIVTRSPNRTFFAEGESVRLTAVPDAGWEFTGWTGGASGSQNPLDLIVDADVSLTAHFASAEAALAETLITAGAVWKYRDDGADLGTPWSYVGYNDAAWASGPAQLGYGDGDEATVVGYGPDASNRYVTTYFRRSFSLPEAAVYSALRLDLLRDDGALVYVNGVEVFRSHMPAGTVTSTTLASSPAVGGADESAWYSTIVDPSLLRDGVNVVAVEIHQQAVTSTDISFDLRLTGSLALEQAFLETFDGMPAGAALATQAGWRDDGAGPVVGGANGVAGSPGLGSATDIFTWTAHPFEWNGPDLGRAVFEMDFRSGVAGGSLFDDDRVGWMVNRTGANSDSCFGVQLDPIAGGTAPNIETYWRNEAGTRIERPIVSLNGLITPDTWYRLRLEAQRLGAASARFDVVLTRLDAYGAPVAVVASGTVANTAALGDSAPAARYFAVSPMHPAYKNIAALPAAVDNAGFALGGSRLVPVTLSVFGATPVGGGQVLVNWMSTSETRLAGYELQRGPAADGPFLAVAGSATPAHGTTRKQHSYSFTDPAAGGGPVWYRLRQVHQDGTESYSPAVEALVTAGVEGGGGLVFGLEQNGPNPFSSGTVIRYTLPRETPVELEVFSAAGRRVATLAEGTKRAGRHSVRWEAPGLPNGVYWYRLRAAGLEATRKLVVLR